MMNKMSKCDKFLVCIYGLLCITDFIYCLLSIKSVFTVCKIEEQNKEIDKIKDKFKNAVE